MTGVKLTGAAHGLGKHWSSINWKKVMSQVRRLQMRIAKAAMEGKWNKVKALQWLLTHSYFAKLLAAKRVTSNKGAKTPGVDGVIWNTPCKKIKGAISLKRKGYKALPLKRIEIPKKNGKMRKLGIPTIRDRAMQALYLLALDPVSESYADGNSYGFRLYRACRDAIAQCFCDLAKSYSPRWILEGDIKACFDGISHEWLLENISMDKRVLLQWLKSGFIWQKQLFPTKAGTKQGGIASPTLANMTLDGLEKVIKKSCPRRRKVNFVRYADDFIVTADSKELLQENIIPAIKEFLSVRGLMLSDEKTKIVRIEDGFDFLGQNLRKYDNKLITKPAKDKVKGLLAKVKAIVKKATWWSADRLIKYLNPILRGWCNYHRYVQSSKTFDHINRRINTLLFRWAKRKHSGKGITWILKKYFSNPYPERVFSCWVKDKKGRKNLIRLFAPASVKMLRYIKIKGNSNPYDPIYSEYFKMRRILSNASPVME